MKQIRFLFCALLICAPLSTQALCVYKKSTQLHTKASSKSRVSWKVPKYTPLLPTGKRSRGWVQVSDQDGQLHWARRSHLSSRLRCMAVRRKLAQVKEGAKPVGSKVKVRKLDRYTPLKRLDGFHESDDGQKAWYKAADSRGKTLWVLDTDVWRPIEVVSLGY